MRYDALMKFWLFIRKNGSWTCAWNVKISCVKNRGHQDKILTQRNRVKKYVKPIPSASSAQHGKHYPITAPMRIHRSSRCRPLLNQFFSLCGGIHPCCKDKTRQFSNSRERIPPDMNSYASPAADKELIRQRNMERSFDKANHEPRVLVLRREDIYILHGVHSAPTCKYLQVHV